MTILVWIPVLVAFGLFGSATAAFAGDVAAGEKSFKKCIACHAVGEGAKHKMGPVLNALEGRKAGTVPGFKYSSALQGSDVVWDEEAFKRYIHNPKKAIPGNKMIFVGLKNKKEVDNLWEFLAQFTSDGGRK